MEDAGRRRWKRERRRKKRRSCRGRLSRTGSKDNKLVGLIYRLVGLEWLKKYPPILKKSRQWKQVGLFLITQTVLFDLGCINGLKNLKRLDELKSDSISFTAKQLLSLHGTFPWVTAGRCTLLTGPSGLRPRPRSSHPTPLPSPSLPEIHHPSQGCSRHQAPSALEQRFSYCSRVSSAR